MSLAPATEPGASSLSRQRLTPPPSLVRVPCDWVRPRCEHAAQPGRWRPSGRSARTGLGRTALRTSQAGQAGRGSCEETLSPTPRRRADRPERASTGRRVLSCRPPARFHRPLPRPPPGCLKLHQEQNVICKNEGQRFITIVNLLGKSLGVHGVNVHLSFPPKEGAKTSTISHGPLYARTSAGMSLWPVTEKPSPGQLLPAGRGRWWRPG